MYVSSTLQESLQAAEMRPTAFVQFGSKVLNPAVDRGMVHVQPSFPHHFLQVAIAERVPHVPAHAQQDDLGFKMAPFERGRVVHEGMWDN